MYPNAQTGQDLLNLYNKKNIQRLWLCCRGRHFWNTLFSYIVDTEELQDTTFKATKIQTSSTAPADLTTGEIYFQVKS